jgi:hypothetical protein
MAKKSRIPAKIRNEVFARFNCCAACGTWDAREAGHLVSEANGGAMVLENFVRLCDVCNKVQGTANVVFKAYAAPIANDVPYGDAIALTNSRRAYWAKYCKAAAAGIAKPYRPV